MNITAYDIAQRFIGTKEVAGNVDNPQINAMLRLDAEWPEHDEVPWCSAFMNYVAWLLRLPRSKSLRARSWLLVGAPVALSDARCGFDVVILKRGGGNQPGPEVIKAQGHVALFGRLDVGRRTVMVLGGNQGDSVSVREYPTDSVLGVRRLYHGS